jgi:hypothetical protein
MPYNGWHASEHGRPAPRGTLLHTAIIHERIDGIEGMLELPSELPRRFRSVLSHQFRSLSQYLHAFNDMQLDALGHESCRAEADDFLCDLVARFIDEEYVRRFRRVHRLDFIIVGEQPAERLHQAASTARNVAARLSQRSAGPLTGAERLPVAVFLEQLAMRLDATAAA